MSPNRREAFGVLAFLQWNHDWNFFHFDDETRYRALTQLQELGVGFVRTDICWHDVHRGAGRFDFSMYDRWIPKIRAHGIEPLILLHYNKVRNGPNGEELWNHPPDSFEEFAGYVHATVNRYKTHVSHWEVWNEPNHPLYWTGPKDKMEAYVRLLKLSHAAARKADPACHIYNGGITEPIAEDVENFYARGGRDLTDALNIHTFINPLDPQGRSRFDSILNDVKRIMAANGDAWKKIWITEMGCPGIPDGRPKQAWFSGDAMTEDQQSEWLAKQFDWVKRHPEVEKLFWAFYRDTDGVFKDATDHMGLVRLDLTPKAAFRKFADIIHSETSAG